MHACKFVVCSTLVIALCGCFGGPPPVKPPEFNASKSAAEAMSLYDKDGDQLLSKKELESAPSMLWALDEIDQDDDGSLSEDEIRERINFFLQTGTGRTSLICTVMKGNRPLGDATVRFIPEPFLGDVIQEASGVTTSGGAAYISIQDELSGLQPGFYRVEISKKKPGSDTEMIPSRYNEETTLGVEITSGSIKLANGLTFTL